MPDRYAALTSPTLCPMMADGRTPSSASWAARATWTRKLPAWAIGVEVARESSSGRSSSATSE